MEEIEFEIAALADELENNPHITREILDKAEVIVAKAEIPVEKDEDKEEKDIRQILSEAKIPKRIKYALFGNAVCRSLLIKDPLRMIRQFVLRNPKLQLKEVEDFCKNPNIAEDVLRSVSEKKEWMGQYSLKSCIVMNPRTAPDISLKWLRYLNEPEIKKLAKSKNIPQLISTTAKKRLADIAKRSRGGAAEH